jgi:hypothetical protein
VGAADDIKRGLTKNLTNFTKQRKAEEKHYSAGRWRMSRMTEVRGMYLTEAANEVMRDCYMKASDNNRLPATARQIYYVARPLIEERTDKPLRYEHSMPIVRIGTSSTTTAGISSSRTRSASSASAP